MGGHERQGSKPPQFDVRSGGGEMGNFGMKKWFEGICRYLNGEGHGSSTKGRDWRRLVNTAAG